MFSFQILKKTKSGGRVGVITTKHGTINTPAFVTVGTKATVKGMTPEMVQSIGTQVVLANTYHLYLQPGIDVVSLHGGFGPMMNWHGPTMTDSGGFQVFSLGTAYGKGISKVLEIKDPNFLIPERSGDDIEPLARVGNDGVSFKSHIDGSMHYITPEKSIEIQHALGADIIFAFDECTSPTESYEYQRESLNRTHAWARRSLAYHKSQPISAMQGLFGVIQGGRYEDLRKLSAQTLGAMDFDGYGIGGSFAKEDMATAVKWVNEILPENKPRHLLGIGEPLDLFMAVEYGCDLFDCVAPTRQARNGSLYTHSGRLNILNTIYQKQHMPIEEGCLCYTCKNYTRAYVAHLFRAKEMLAGTLATVHNLYFINKLVADMRQALLEDRFEAFRDKFIERYYTK
jgi:queuine tRNA-ribosyltransferase